MGLVGWISLYGSVDLIQLNWFNWLNWLEGLNWIGSISWICLNGWKDCIVEIVRLVEMIGKVRWVDLVEMAVI